LLPVNEPHTILPVFPRHPDLTRPDVPPQLV